MQNGKGSKKRPTNLKKFLKNWDDIDWSKLAKKDKMEYFIKKTQRVLFCDVDGVLNDFDWFKSDHYQYLKRHTPLKNGDLKDNRGQFCKCYGALHLNPMSIVLLNEIIQQTGCKVVISSTWRRIFTLEEIVGMLVDRGLQKTYVSNFIGMTPILDQQAGPLFTAPVRGNEIQAWMESHGVKQNQVCILDDDADMVHLSHRLVRVMGLNTENTEAVIKMLTAD